MLVVVPHMNGSDLHQFQYSTETGPHQALSTSQHRKQRASADSAASTSHLPPSSTVPTPHVNAVAGPSRYPPQPALNPSKSRSIQARPSASGGNKDFPPSPSQAFFKQRGSLRKDKRVRVEDYAGVCARQATALTSRICQWIECGRELASLAQLIQHCKLHVTKQDCANTDLDDSQNSNLVSCAWRSCAVQCSSHGELIDHVVQHVQHHRIACPVIGCTYRERTLTFEHVSSHSDLDLECLTSSARPTFVTAPVPRTPPPIPASYARIPSSEIYATVVPARSTLPANVKRDIGIMIQARPLHDDYFQAGVEARSWAQGRSSTIFRSAQPDPIPAFEPVHSYMQIGSKTARPRMAPAPSSARGGQISLSSKKRKRQALSIPAQLITPTPKRAEVLTTRRTVIESSTSEELDREAAAIAGQSIGFKFLVERLRLEGKMDETSRDRA